MKAGGNLNIVDNLLLLVCCPVLSACSHACCYCEKPHLNCALNSEPPRDHSPYPSPPILLPIQ